MRHHKPSFFRFIHFLLAITIIMIACQPSATTEVEFEPTTPSGVEKPKTDQWKNNKYSMFIHFGAYSTLGGIWKGKRIKKGYSEQIRSHAGIFNDEYEEVAHNFKPSKWNPDSITTLAKDAGMRSIIITAKHHDGFCLFKTSTTHFNIVDFTSYKKDIISDLSKVCNKKGLNFGVYFSVIDWHLPSAYPISGHNADPIPPAHHQTNMQQVEELLSNYGPVSEIWFDMGANTPRQSRELRDLVHKLQPNCLVSGRIGNDQGDFNVMGDNFYPNFKMEVPWQTPASMFNETWGYRSWQERGSTLEKAREKLRSFINVISHGGNYLLNIGPRGDGSLVNFESEVLRLIGRWIKVNKDAIYGTSSSPFHGELEFGQVTCKNNKIFLFIDSIPASNRLRLPGLKNKITAARFLGSGISVQFDQINQTQEIQWTAPAMADPMEMPVLEVTLEGTPEINDEPLITPTGDSLVLSPKNALPIRSFTGADYYTLIPSETGQTWHFNAPTNQVKAKIYFTEYEKGRQIEITSGAKTQKVTLNGKASSLIKNNNNLKMGPSFRSKAYRGGLADVHVKTNGTSRLQIATEKWTGPDETKAHNRPPLPRTSYYYLTEITSDSAQHHCFTITGNDGLQVWLNGDNLLLDRNQQPGQPMSRTLVLSLKRGKNNLLVKNYNRQGNPEEFSLKPNPEAKWNTMILQLPVSRDISTLILKRSDPPTPHTPLDLPNIWLKIMPSEKK